MTPGTIRRSSRATSIGPDGTSHVGRSRGPVLAVGQHRLVVDGTLVDGRRQRSPESFSDARRYSTLDRQLALGESLVRDGADMGDVGGQSAITGRAAIAAAEEADRVVPVIAELRRRHPDLLISVDTYKVAVAEAAIAAGASIVNDVSGLRDPELAALCSGRRPRWSSCTLATAPSNDWLTDRE